MNKCKTYRYRFISRIVIEAITPLEIGSGNKSILTDALINRDVNGMPFIPGTTIAGLLRHQMDKKSANEIMGYQKAENGMGSKLIVTGGKFIDSNGKVIDGLFDVDNLDDETRRFLKLPIRQHAKIDHRGVTVNNGKFDEEVIMKGSRFCFEIEMISDDDKDEEQFKRLINFVNEDTFRIGGGSRSGFGQIKVRSCKYRKLDFANIADFDLYLTKSSSLSEEWGGYANCGFEEKSDNKKWIIYKLQLRPENFLLFGSGFGNDKADMTFVRESCIQWKNDNKGEVVDQESVLVIPASSVKGAISHRTAYYYNMEKNVFADQIDDIDSYVGKNNEAVQKLFGSEGKNDRDNADGKKRGTVLFSDVIQKRHKAFESKVLNHVAIDRFTGGAINGALFSEETLYAKAEDAEFDIAVNRDAFNDNFIQEAFENTLVDICKGLLPLGGGVNRGNGCFNGKLIKDGETIYEQD